MCVFVCVCTQATECDSMTLLMKKLDHLSEGIQEVHSVDSFHTDEASGEEEQQSTAVSQAYSNQVCFIHMVL